MITLLKSSLILLSFNIFGAELKVLSDSIPYEVELMFKHIKYSSLSKAENEKLRANLTLLNEDLGALDKRNILFLFKSEIYKGIFTNQYLKLNSKLQISSSVIDSTKKKLAKHKVVYSLFSQWTIQSILNDLEPFLEDSFINRYQNVNRGNSKDVLKSRKLVKIYKYISPFLAAFLNKSPEDFNTLQKNIILDTFSRIALKSYYFQIHYIKGAKADAPLFSIPSEKQTIKEASDSSAMQKKQSSEQATELIESLGEEDLSTASEKIDEALKKTDSN